MDDPQLTIHSLTALRRNVLLLRVANEYLCENPYLIKFGNDIEKNIRELKSDIISLKKSYPGKFATEIKTDVLLDNISKQAQSMIKPCEETKRSCISGEIGRSLESDFRAVSEAVRLIRNQVQGSAVTYGTKDSVSGFGKRIGTFFSGLARSLFPILKIFAGVILVGALAFSYLFFTMDKETTYLKKIDENQAYIAEQQKLIEDLENKKKKISEEIKSKDKKNFNKIDKITVLELEVQIQKLNQDSYKAEALIDAYEKNIMESRERIEELNNTPFIKRLLRQD